LSDLRGIMILACRLNHFPIGRSDMRKHNSIFGQILQLISRYEFQKIVSEHASDRYYKKFSTWDHMVSMLFAQLTGQDGLRGIETGMASHMSKLYHLGSHHIKRSTLSYANTNRDHHVFQEIFELVLKDVLKKAPRHSFPFPNDLYSIDATTIDLCLSMFDWATFREKKGGIKVHVKLNHSGYLPSVVTVSTAKQHEVTQINKMKLKTGDVVVFDRGYTDFEQYANYCDENIYFVTRLKKNANYKITKRNDVSPYDLISSDHIIEPCGFYTKKKCPMKLRRIRVKDPETGKYIVLLTNHMKWTPDLIAAIYKDRWQIEIFFKTMKQNLKIKSFLGTSRNAVCIQIWIAMITYLLLSYLKFLSRYPWTINSLMNVVPLLLFSRRCLLDWLNEPFESPPPPEEPSYQMVLW